MKNQTASGKAAAIVILVCLFAMFTCINSYAIAFNGTDINEFAGSLVNHIKPKAVAAGDGVYYTNDPGLIQKDNNGNLVVPEQYYFRGLDPDNWIQFGQVSATDSTPLLWRILYLSDEGIKIVYEGTRQADGSAPPEDGKIATSSWNGDIYELRNNYWETPVALKQTLQDWYQNILYVANRDVYAKPIHWPIALITDQNPNTLRFFVDNERKDMIADYFFYPGVSLDMTAAGLINPSYFILSSSNPAANESYATVNDKSLESGVDNFLRKSYVFWTNNAYNGTGGKAWHIGAVGRVSNSFTNNVYGIRPVVNLRKNMMYFSGAGTLSDPYVIAPIGLELTQASASPAFAVTVDARTINPLFAETGATIQPTQWFRVAETDTSDYTDSFDAQYNVLPEMDRGMLADPNTGEVDQTMTHSVDRNGIYWYKAVVNNGGELLTVVKSIAVTSIQPLVPNPRTGDNTDTLMTILCIAGACLAICAIILMRNKITPSPNPLRVSRFK